MVLPPYYAFSPNPPAQTEIKVYCRSKNEIFPDEKCIFFISASGNVISNTVNEVALPGFETASSDETDETTSVLKVSVLRGIVSSACTRSANTTSWARTSRLRLTTAWGCSCKRLSNFLVCLVASWAPFTNLVTASALDRTCYTYSAFSFPLTRDLVMRIDTSAIFAFSFSIMYPRWHGLFTNVACGCFSSACSYSWCLPVLWWVCGFGSFPLSISFPRFWDRCWKKSRSTPFA